MAVGRDLDLVAWQHSYHAEGRPIGLPALSAAADVIVGNRRIDPHLNRVTGAAADQRAALKIGASARYPLIDCRMNSNHDGFLPSDAVGTFAVTPLWLTHGT